MKKHSKYSPSGNNSRNLCRQWIPDNGPAGEAAVRGSAMHDAFETGDHSKLINDREREIVRFAEDFIGPLLQGADFVEREKRYEINYGDIRTTGIADIVVGLGDTLLVGDLKTGEAMPAVGKDDLQTPAYAIGAIDEHDGFDYVRTVVIHPPSGTVATAEWTREELEETRSRLNKIHLECGDENSEPNPGSACKYCGAKANCSALIETAMSVSKNLGMQIPDNMDPKNLPTDFHQQYGPQMVEVLEPWCKAEKAECVRLAKEGIEFENYELRSRNQARRVEDMECAVNAARAVGMTDEEILECATLSIPKTEKLLVSKAGKESKEVFIEILEACLKEPAAPISFLAKKRAGNLKQ